MNQSTGKSIDRVYKYCSSRYIFCSSICSAEQRSRLFSHASPEAIPTRFEEDSLFALYFEWESRRCQSLWLRPSRRRRRTRESCELELEKEKRVVKHRSITFGCHDQRRLQNILDWQQPSNGIQRQKKNNKRGRMNNLSYVYSLCQTCFSVPNACSMLGVVGLEYEKKDVEIRTVGAVT